jgi:PKHD-type hydroxylase
MDVGDGPIAMRRKLTMVAQLSDPADYRGGRLEINGDGRARQAPTGQGSVVVFPSFALHRVEPVSEGERWSLTLWAHGPTFR